MKEIIKKARADAGLKGAKKVEFSVDCVAYAPHRLIDVQDWDVDFCFFSLYKVQHMDWKTFVLTHVRVRTTRFTVRIRQLCTSGQKCFGLPCLP